MSDLKVFVDLIAETLFTFMAGMGAGFILRLGVLEELLTARRELSDLKQKNEKLRSDGDES